MHSHETDTPIAPYIVDVNDQTEPCSLRSQLLIALTAWSLVAGITCLIFSTGSCALLLFGVAALALSLTLTIVGLFTTANPTASKGCTLFDDDSVDMDTTLDLPCPLVYL